MSTADLTARQAELLAAVVKTMSADINWEEVSKQANYTTAKYARDQWTIVKRKLAGGTADNNGGNSGDGEEGTPGKKKATPRKRKSDDDTETPVKKSTPRKGRKPAAKSVEADADDGDDEEGNGEIKPEETVKAEPGEDQDEMA